MALSSTRLPSLSLLIVSCCAFALPLAWAENDADDAAEAAKAVEKAERPNEPQASQARYPKKTPKLETQGTSKAESPSTVTMEKYEVSTDRGVSMNSIDRKTYTVGKDIVSAAGSVSSLLQNIPSINVDVEGAVSLRGSDNVTILIDGRKSPLMGKNRADVLDQMPADSIERIEVITNPSAKYKPDGTAGIINLVTKKKAEPGYSGSVAANVGNDDRANVSTAFSTSRGKLSFTGNAALRQDDRLRTTKDHRIIKDLNTGAVIEEEQDTQSHSRPLSKIIRANLRYAFTKQDELELSGSYNHRSFTQVELARTQDSTKAQPLSLDFDRARLDTEYEKELELGARYQHSFEKEGQDLSSEFKWTKKNEQEDNRYTETHRLPSVSVSHDTTLIKPFERGTEWVNEYVHPLADEGKIEAGYTREANKGDYIFEGAYQDAVSGNWLSDTVKTNRFLHEDTLNAVYATCSQKMGNFGALAGVRMEEERGESLLVNTGQKIPNNYFRLYPSLHLAYALAEHHELQMNYSHRVRRPESDDLNPFAEYKDPKHLRTGNPLLKPEDIHSIEFGHQYRTELVSVITTAYYRNRYNGMTDITSLDANGVETTTKANLGKSKAYGMEFATDAALNKAISLNFSTNLYSETIDASNIGFNATKTAVSGIAKLGLSILAGKSTIIQVNSSATSSRLTPQGRRGATKVANIGMRHEFLQHRLAFVLTVSDIFNSLYERSNSTMAGLDETIVRRRSPRAVYAGFVYKFGKAQKKSKDDTLKFDDSL